MSPPVAVAAVEIRHSQPDDELARPEAVPPCSLPDCTQAGEIAAMRKCISELKTDIAELKDILGRPPNPAQGLAGKGMAGTLSELAMKSAAPSKALKTLGMVLAVAAPLAIGLAWLIQHLRFAP